MVNEEKLSKQLLSTFSSLCFSVKIVFNYGYRAAFAYRLKGGIGIGPEIGPTSLQRLEA
jgi:hypothetical protein